MKIDIQSYETDKLIGKKVRIYWNLHRKVWSVQDYKTKRVISYCYFIKLSSVEFKVSQAGRERVLKEKKKNVHAYAIGTIEDYKPFLKKDKVQGVTYNPYKYALFVCMDNEKATLKASTVWCQGRTMVASNLVYTMQAKHND